MCAILGGVGKVPDIGSIALAMASMGHRGPDGSGRHMAKTGFVAHARLAIVDPANGEQPIFNESGSIAAVVNGEFYDSECIRSKLIASGHKFRSRSDSEILVHLYEEHGVKCLDYLNGEFAFLLLDGEKLFAARDRFGVRPLFLHKSPDGIYFASEEQALGKLLGLPCRLDTETMAFASMFQYTPEDRTWFEGISSLPSGNFALADGRSLAIRRYWEAPWKCADNEGSDQSELLQRIGSSIRKRVPSEARACCHLSGGLDSSIIAAESGLPAFTIGFTGGSGYNEAKLAEGTAEHLGIPLTVVPVSGQDMALNFASVAKKNAAPFINSHAVAKYILSREINAQGFKVALTGEGSDELFFGYTHLQQDFHGASHSEFSVAGIHTPRPGGSDDFSLPGYTPTWIKAKHQLFAPVRHVLGITMEREALARTKMTLVMQELGNISPAEAGTASWTRFALQSYILRSLDDRMGMTHAVESRIPFLDHGLWEFVRSNWSIAAHFIGPEKSILRELYRNRLPEHVITGAKHPFMAPPVAGNITGARDRLVDAFPTKHTALCSLFDSSAGPGAPPEVDAVLTFLLSCTHLQEAW